LFDVSYKDKQRICGILDISMYQQQQIQLLSHRKRQDKRAT
jgi:hypothetical protein